MPTVTDFTKAYGVQPNTIRHWSKNFADFLSPGANPEKGKRRMYSYDDAEVIALIAEMRQQYESYDNIRAALADGDRGLWPPEDRQAAEDDAGEAQSGEGAPLALITQLTAKASSLEGELKATIAERNRLIEEKNELQNSNKDLQTTNDELLERAIRAETIIGVEKLGQDARTPPGGIVGEQNESGGEGAKLAAPPTRKLNRWQRIRRRIGGNV
jgi:DNA-binding transcriptional MerR regulator